MSNLIHSGFIKLTGANNKEPIYIKARHVVSIGNHHQEGSYVWTVTENFWVSETSEQIADLLDAVHPEFL